MSALAHQQHCRSYYAASAGVLPEYPVLEGQHECDVTIIGAGFTGITAALELREKGYSVINLEGNRVGWGASGRNGGQLIGGISGEAKLQRFQDRDCSDLIWEMRWAGNEIVRRNVEKYAIDCDLKFGYLDAAIKPRHMRDLEDEFSRLERRNFPHEYRMLDEMQIREAIGTRAYRGGLLNMGSGHLHPLKLCLGEARAAVAEGAQIFERSAVTRIEHGARPKVHTDKGQVESDFVILAGGAYHALEEENIGGIVFPAGSFIIATEQLPEELLGEINPMCLAVCDPNYVLDYFRTSADGRMLFGGRCNYSGREPRSIRKTMQPRMVKIYPQLKDVRIEYEWGGKIGIVINRIPYMGRIGKNVFFSQGYCGHGVNVTHLAGQLLAEVVAGTSERFDIFERVKHYRLPGARWIGNNLVALGMVYFRMLDMRP